MIVKEDQHQDDIRLLLDRLPGAAGGVLHVGAHRGEEVEAYLEAGFDRVALVEANPRLHEELLRRFAGEPRVEVFHCALSDHSGTVDLHIHTSRSGSTEPASLLRLKRFKEIVPTLHTPESVRVPCHTLDSFLELNGLPAQAFGLLNVDVQGAELRVLRGARRALRAIDAVISEVGLAELYEDGALEPEIVEFMTECGFRKVAGIYHPLSERGRSFPAWGECLFLRAAGERESAVG